MKDRIAQAIAHTGLTSSEFGDRIGVSQSTVSLWRSGSRNPSNQAIRSISREYGISEEWLMTGEGPMLHEKSKAEAAADIADGYMNENSDLKNAILQVVNEMDEDLLIKLKAEVLRILSIEKGQD